MFLKFVGRVAISNSDIVRVSSPTSSSQIEDSFSRGVQLYLPKNDHIVLDTDYVQLCPEMFHQCINGFRCAPPNYQFSANSIYVNRDECSCRNMKLDRIMKTYNHTLQQKLSSLTTNYIQFERPFKYMKECPPKDYCQLIEIIESYVDQQIDKYNKKIIVLVGSGRA